MRVLKNVGIFLVVFIPGSLGLIVGLTVSAWRAGYWYSGTVLDQWAADPDTNGPKN